MSEKILVPELGESITEASIARWIKSKGETVNADEPIVELETDKVNLEVPSPVNGIISEINFKDGDTVEVGAVLGTILEKNEGADNLQDTVKIEKIVPKEIEKKLEEIDEKVEEINEKDREIEDKVEEYSEDKLNGQETFTANQEEEPLILYDETTKEKENEQNNLSPAVRKIVTEKKN